MHVNRTRALYLRERKNSTAGGLPYQPAAPPLIPTPGRAIFWAILFFARILMTDNKSLGKPKKSE